MKKLFTALLFTLLVLGFTTSVFAKNPTTISEDLQTITYKDETFIRLLDKGVCPETRWVEGSNYFDVNFKIDERTGRIVVMGAIDNVVKGAAGQAVQNMNLIFGLPENEGLMMVPLFP